MAGVCVSTADSLGHINSDFIGADANVSVSSQMRGDAVTAAHTRETDSSFERRGGKNSPSQRNKIVRECVFVCVFLFSSLDNRIAA